jgi:hypothetical protein
VTGVAAAIHAGTGALAAAILGDSLPIDSPFEDDATGSQSGGSAPGETPPSREVGIRSLRRLSGRRHSGKDGALMRVTIGILIALALIACGGDADDKLPAQVIEMYDASTPDGTIEIEATRDGTILEIEVTYPVDKVPQAVKDAAEKDLPGPITGAEFEYIDG